MDPPSLSPAAPPAGKKSLASKLAGAVGRSPYASLAIIVVLTILVISLYVYYHGFLRVGPYAAGFTASAGNKVKTARPESGGASDSRAKDASSAAPADSGDPETERLIAAINSK
jgi:hypothetical protein